MNQYKEYLIKGTICQSHSPNQIEIVENGYIPVLNGRSFGVFRELPERFAALPLLDFSDLLVLPGMTDLHIHAPQFAFRGIGMDMELLDWLNTYTFPEESKYRELEYADRAYSTFVSCLRRSVTTRAVVFGTIHREATELLMEKLEASGLHTLVGKVNMDRNSPDSLREPSAAASLADTERWLLETRDRFSHTKPILTPRFVPSCSDELMAGLGDLSRRYGLPVQSHLSENLSEVEWVKELCPGTSCYGDAYDRFGLFGGTQRCVMAHCVHSGPTELELMKERGVYIAHSPESNMNLASGVAPISRYLELGLKVGLATDMAAGSHENMLRAMKYAIQVSKLRWRLQDETVKPLTLDQAFWLATAGGGSFFGPVGKFDPGYEFDAVVLNEQGLDHPQPLDPRSRLERSVYLAGHYNIEAKFVAGTRLI